MSDLIWMALALAGAWLGLQAIWVVVVFVQLLRMRLHRPRLVDGPPPEPLSADQHAALDELRALGFEPVHDWNIEYGPRRLHGMLLRHAELPAYAGISLIASTFTGYPVSFYSFRADGTVLDTSNRTQWLQPQEPAGVDRVDAYADSLAAHWQAHRERLADPTLLRLDADVAVERVRALTQAYADLLDRGELFVAHDGAWHPTLRAAARMAARWARVRRRLARPYDSVVTRGEHQSAFYARCYAETEAQRAERLPRVNLKATVLVASLLLSLLAWGLLLDARNALALVAVLLVHETGHALAMRAFGYRDLSMFFIPLFGALVTGTPRALAAWKQAIVLLAGPMPALLAGLAWLWFGPGGAPGTHGAFNAQNVAWMAVLVNLFNLLPISPLDGGQLVEIALFSRWPRLRLVFIALGVMALAAVAWALDSTATWIITLVLALSLVGQLRATRLELAWQPGLDPAQQVRHLFEVARHRLRAQTFTHQYPLVRAVFLRRSVHRPRAWESGLALGALIVVWALALQTLGQLKPWQKAQARTTPAQQAFDARYEDAEYAEDARAALDALRRDAALLGADDPRQLDLEVLDARLDEDLARGRARLEAFANGIRDGHFNRRSDLATDVLEGVFQDVADAPAAERATALQAAIARLDARNDGQLFGAVLRARLRQAQAVDESGDEAAASALLQQLAARAEALPDCRGCARQVLTAHTWFDLAHGRAPDAIARLRGSAHAEHLQHGSDDIALAYAWALLADGRTDEALAQMRLASHSRGYTPSRFLRLLGRRAREPQLRDPLDLAHVLQRAGRSDEAATLIGDKQHWTCRIALAEDAERYAEPWQQPRTAALRETARLVCPPATAEDEG